MAHRQLRRELRLLEVWAGLSTVSLVVITGAAGSVTHRWP